MRPVKLPPLPEWRHVGGAWTCDDASEQAFAWRAAIQGFDLPAFDAWLATLPPSPARDELLERRELARAADPNNGHQRIALDWLRLRRYTIEREGFLLPLAQHGAAMRGKPKGAAGPMRKLIRRMLAAKGDRLTARELWLLCKALPEAKRRDVEFFDSAAWVKGHGNVSFGRFANIMSEEKKRSK